MSPRILFTTLSLVAVCLVASGQQSPEITAESASDAQPAMQAQTGSRPTTQPVISGRLPRYFAAVVSPQQRIQIYQIQGTFREQVVQLQQQLAELKLAEMQEIEAVLSDKQLQQVRQRRQQALQRLAASSNDEVTEGVSRRAPVTGSTGKGSPLEESPMEGSTLD